MGCGCGSKATYNGARVISYTVTFPDGSTQTFLTDLEAKRAVRQAGGGSITANTS